MVLDSVTRTSVLVGNSSSLYLSVTSAFKITTVFVAVTDL